MKLLHLLVVSSLAISINGCKANPTQNSYPPLFDPYRMALSIAYCAAPCFIFYKAQKGWSKFLKYNKSITISGSDKGYTVTKTSSNCISTTVFKKKPSPWLFESCSSTAPGFKEGAIFSSILLVIVPLQLWYFNAFFPERTIPWQALRH